ncbi:arylformamidase [Ectobacillus sp. JY-23]|uniref:arylformamidase n=1 Tax=Ectobacillus sp. JY-23 TaxID=2933872 RepID=UPI001FF0F31F|nr:arylformamidase [Ectobacillus sp. JY-23]UOY91649.1 arylformamidase [Ectobacillus sp. JY-23]
MIIDISRPLHTKTPTWPGDTPFSYEISWSKEQSGSVNVGKLTMSIHTGTHVDAPFHFDNEGKQTCELPLERYIGKARIVDMTGKQSIGVSDFQALDIKRVERLLLRTSSWGNSEVFPESITYLEADLAPYLAAQGVQLIGIDVPSVDPLNSKELLAHHALHRNDIHILEGLDLEGVHPGDYELVALPLALIEGDGSPVRAILRSWKGE